MTDDHRRREKPYLGGVSVLLCADRLPTPIKQDSNAPLRVTKVFDTKVTFTFEGMKVFC